MSVLDAAGFVSEEPQRAVRQSSITEGMIMTGVIDARTPRKFTLRYDPAHRSQIQALMVDVMANPYTAQSWTPPGESTPIHVVYSPPAVDFTPISGLAASVSVQIEELLTTD